MDFAPRLGDPPHPPHAAAWPQRVSQALIAPLAGQGCAPGREASVGLATLHARAVLGVTRWPQEQIGSYNLESLGRQTGATTAKNVPYDLKLRIIGGNGTDGALDLSDLESLIQFIQGAASQDPSLDNLSLVDVKKGSRVAVLKAQPHKGLPGLLSPTCAISEIFSKKTRSKKEALELPNGVLGAFKSWTRGGAKVEVTYHSGERQRPKRITFDQKCLATAKPKRAKSQTEDKFVGRLVRLHSDEENFGVETTQGILLCPFPSHERESWVALYERIVCVTAKAPPKPTSGRWLASETLGIEVRPDPPALDFGQEIPGLVPPKLARKEGFDLDDLFPGLKPEDADSLADFLKDYREH